MPKYENMRACWPKDTAKIIGAPRPSKCRDYGNPEPVSSTLSKIAAAARKQLADRGNRDEAIITAAFCAFLAGVILSFWVLFPAAVDQQIESCRQVVAESRGAR